MIDETDQTGDLLSTTEKSNLVTTLTSLYRLSSESAVENTTNLIITLRDPRIGGVVGVNVSDRKSPFAFYYPDPETTPFADVPEGIFLINQLNAMTPTDTRTLGLAAARGMGTYINPHTNAKTLGIQITADLKHTGTVHVNEVHYNQRGYVWKLPLYLHSINQEKAGNTAPLDPVAEAVVIAKLAQALPSETFCIPIAVNHSQLFPLLDRSKSTRILLAERTMSVQIPNITGFDIVKKAEVLEIGGKPVIVDPVEIGVGFPTLKNTRELLKRALVGNR